MSVLFLVLPLGETESYAGKEMNPTTVTNKYPSFMLKQEEDSQALLTSPLAVHLPEAVILLSPSD